MIEADVTPRCRDMTTSAICTKLSVMCIPRRVTGIAIPGCTSINSIGMTACTGNSTMATFQREARSAMVKMDILPIAGIMTIRTVTSHLSGMWIFMTGGTVHGRPLEQKVRMAACAGNSDMSTYQVEYGRGVIERHILPVRGLVA